MRWARESGRWSVFSKVKKSLAFSLAAGALALSAVTSTPPAQARSSGGVLVIRSDQGGFIKSRLSEIQKIRRDEQRVEIRGKVCLSTCTMFLGVDDVCVSPNTSFGFHGPAMAVGRLTPEQFDFLSRLIASHYPPALQRWYLEEGRNRTSGMYRVSGAQLIRMGVPACDTPGAGSR